MQWYRDNTAGITSGVEGTVDMIKAQARTMRLSLETRYGKKIQEEDHRVPWMIGEAGKSIN